LGCLCLSALLSSMDSHALRDMAELQLSVDKIILRAPRAFRTTKRRSLKRQLAINFCYLLLIIYEVSSMHANKCYIPRQLNFNEKVRTGTRVRTNCTSLFR
jgi:hypothetical protein